MTSTERRVTVSNTIYPTLKEWAERDGVTVADVTNAILLQTIRPYGQGCFGSTTPMTSVPTLPDTAQAIATPDPYQVANLDSW